MAVHRRPALGDHALHSGRQVGEVAEHFHGFRRRLVLPETVTDQDAPAGSQVLARRRESGEQPAEGVRGPDTEHEVEGALGVEVGGRLVVQHQTFTDAQAARGLVGPAQRVFGDIDALGRQPRAGAQGAEKPLSSSAPEIEHPRVGPGNPALKQFADRIIIEGGLDRMIGMSDPGDLFAIHRRIVTPPRARTHVHFFACFACLVCLVCLTPSGCLHPAVRP